MKDNNSTVDKNLYSVEHIKPKIIDLFIHMFKWTNIVEFGR